MSAKHWRSKNARNAARIGNIGLRLGESWRSFVCAEEGNRKTLRWKVGWQDTATYPFTAARADLIHYFFAGALSAGLQQLGQDAAINAQAQKADLTGMQLTNVPAPSGPARAFLTVIAREPDAVRRALLA